MSTGSRVAIGCMLFALCVAVVLVLYGRDSLSRREPDSPAAIAREMVQADNTVVGMVGAIRTFETLTVTERGTAGSRTAVLDARVLGARDSGRLHAELALDGDRWTMRRGSFTLSDGTTIPVAGSAGR